MKLFHFYRIEDHSGVSGTGPVVEGVQFTNGWCALRWMSKNSSLCFYRSLADVKAIHGHGGKTEIIVHDLEPIRKQNAVSGGPQFELFMDIIERVSSVVSSADDSAGTAAETRKSIEEIKTLLDQLEKKINRKRTRAA